MRIQPQLNLKNVSPSDRNYCFFLYLEKHHAKHFLLQNFQQQLQHRMTVNSKCYAELRYIQHECLVNRMYNV